MLSLEVRKLAEKLNLLSFEDKQWLLQQLTQQLNITNPEADKLNQQEQAQKIISETLNEVLALPDNCYDEVWQRFEEVCTRISQDITED